MAPWGGYVHQEKRQKSHTKQLKQIILEHREHGSVGLQLGVSTRYHGTPPRRDKEKQVKPEHKAHK